MEAKVIWLLVTSLVLVLSLCGSSWAWTWGSDKVKLMDIQVLTLKHGAMTTGRRSSPVPQLKCVGGSSLCEYNPEVVQCYNRGSDGVDAQWECKADMDNAYRFGDISVTCEGYEYPDDPYVLKGSCGLEYKIEYTAEGKGHSSHQDYYQDQRPSGCNWNPGLNQSVEPKSSFLSDLLCFVVVLLFMYAFYKTCINPGARTVRNDYYHEPGQLPQPPTYYASINAGYPNNNYGGSCGSYARSSNPDANFCGNSNGSGFWNGAATGGLLGYMFGSRNSTNTGGGTTCRPRPSSSGHSSSSWGGGGFSSSSGSRSSSGFGGTSRR